MRKQLPCSDQLTPSKLGRRMPVTTHPSRCTPLHWDNALVHIAAVVKDWFTTNGLQLLELPPYSPDLAPADFFLFRRVKEDLANLSLNQESLKNAWEGVTRSITAEVFATAFVRWYERCKKCVRISSGYVEKSLKINVLLSVTV